MTRAETRGPAVRTSAIAHHDARVKERPSRLGDGNEVSVGRRASATSAAIALGIDRVAVRDALQLGRVKSLRRRDEELLNAAAADPAARRSSSSVTGRARQRRTARCELRRSAARCAALPVSRPRSRASARMYVPPPQVIVTSSDDGVAPPDAPLVHVDGDGRRARAASQPRGRVRALARDLLRRIGRRELLDASGELRQCRDRRRTDRVDRPRAYVSPVTSSVSVSAPKPIVAS